MPPHHTREQYHHYWYEDLPEGCKKAAAAMGYVDQAHWDEDKPVNFDTAKFTDLSMVERRAAWFLGWDVFDKKLDIWWEDTDEDTKNAAHAVGWSKETWDGDWAIQDLPIEHKYWKDLTEEEKEGATFFGYTQVTWDETGETEWEEDEAASVPAPKKKMNKPSSKPAAAAKTEEKKDDSGNSAAKKKIKFTVSRLFGNENGEPFDDSNHRRVKKITLRSGAIIDSIQMTYENGPMPKHGGEGGGEMGIDIAEDEYINAVTVRHSNVVQALTFHTSKGRTIGPIGGKGRLIDRKGEDEKVEAPAGMGLSGIKGTAGGFIHSIAFRWATIP